VANAEEIAATHGVDVVILGNNDLSSFSGWSQNDPRYQDALVKVHDAALKYGKYFGNAGAQYLTATCSAPTPAWCRTDRRATAGSRRHAVAAPVAVRRRPGGARRQARRAGRRAGHRAAGRRPGHGAGGRGARQ
jgi:hypothetical protein